MTKSIHKRAKEKFVEIGIQRNLGKSKDTQVLLNIYLFIYEGGSISP